MKRLIAALLLPVLCLSAAICSGVYTDRTLSGTIDDLESMQKKDEFDEKKAHDIFDSWTQNKKLLAILLKHEDVDEIEMHLNNVVYTAETKSDSYRDELDEAKGFITGVRDGEKLSIQSIF